MDLHPKAFHGIYDLLVVRERPGPLVARVRMLTTEGLEAKPQFIPQRRADVMTQIQLHGALQFARVHVLAQAVKRTLASTASPHRGDRVDSRERGRIDGAAAAGHRVDKDNRTRGPGPGGLGAAHIFGVPRRDVRASLRTHAWFQISPRRPSRRPAYKSEVKMMVACDVGAARALISIKEGQKSSYMPVTADGGSRFTSSKHHNEAPGHSCEQLMQQLTSAPRASFTMHPLEMENDANFHR